MLYKPMTVEQATKDMKTYSSLIAYTKEEIDELTANLAEYADKLARACHYLSD